MAKYKLIVLINAIEGREDEFNNWFINQHVPDVLTIPGMKTAQRFELAEHQREGAKKEFRFLTLYDVETDDLPWVIHEMKIRQGTPQMVSTDTIAPPASIHFFEPITELVTSAED